MLQPQKGGETGPVFFLFFTGNSVTTFRAVCDAMYLTTAEKPSQCPREGKRNPERKTPAGRPEGERLRLYLPVDSASWEEMERSEQQQIVTKIVERISYDRRLGQGKMRWREEVGGPQSEILIRANKEPLVRQTPPPPIEKAISVQRAREHVPQITKLLALAVRLEGLLRQGTGKDYEGFRVHGSRR
jgi:hypothetical protein